MNTQTIIQDKFFNPSIAGPRGPAISLAGLAYTVTRGLVAFTLSAIFLTLSAWAATEPGLAMYLQAFNWSTSFIFLAVALEARQSSTALMALATGIAILLFTGLSTRFGLEFALWGTLLMCAWLTIAMIKR